MFAIPKEKLVELINQVPDNTLVYFESSVTTLKRVGYAGVRYPYLRQMSMTKMVPTKVMKIDTEYVINMNCEEAEVIVSEDHKSDHGLSYKYFFNNEP